MKESEAEKLRTEIRSLRGQLAACNASVDVDVHPTRNIPGSTTVVYKTDSALSDAVEFAHSEAVKKYPGGQVMVDYINAIIRQHLAGADSNP